MIEMIPNHDDDARNGRPARGSSMACRHQSHRQHRQRRSLCSGGCRLPLALLLAAAGLAAAAPLPAPAAEDPAAILREIDAAALEPARAVTLNGVRLAAGLASIH